MSMPTQRLRRVFYWLLPPFILDDDEGEKVAYSITHLLDHFVERVRQGLEARFPSRAGDTALRMLGSDRGIVRGRSETRAQYARRLKEWRYPRGHRVRGSAFGLLAQVWAYFDRTACATADASGNVHERASDGTETWSHGNTWDWDGASLTNNWGRFWVLLTAPGEAGIFEHPDLDTPALWGGALGTPGYTIGQTNVGADDVNAIRGLFEDQTDVPWNPSGTRPEWVIVSLTGAIPAPDGTWGRWSKLSGGTSVAARASTMRFWALRDVLKQDGGIATQFPLLVVLPGGGAPQGGSSASFPADTTLPSGVTYAGNSASFPALVYLPDDGDLPA